MSSWDTVTEFSFRRAKSYLQDGQEVEFGTDSQGWRAPREFRNLCWEGGSANSLPELPAMSDTAPKNLDETIQKEIILLMLNLFSFHEKAIKFIHTV